MSRPGATDADNGVRGSRIRHALKLGVVVAGMFGFGYALVPIYDMLCDALGINGRVVLEASAAPAAIDTSRTVTVEFVTTVNGGRVLCPRLPVGHFRWSGLRPSLLSG